MVIFSDCADCKNYILSKDELYPKCKAFMDGIPKEWFLIGNPKSVKECNNGIGFEPDEEELEPGGLL